MKTFFVYILASKSGTLYVGMTGDLKGRVYQHKMKTFPGFTEKYNIDRLLYFETFRTAMAAIQREKQIKSYRREKKIKLIDTKNLGWKDLADQWYEQAKEIQPKEKSVPLGKSAGA